MPCVGRRTEEEKQKEGGEARDDRRKLGGVAESVAIVPKLFGPANPKRGLHDAFCGPARSQQAKSKSGNQVAGLGDTVHRVGWSFSGPC